MANTFITPSIVARMALATLYNTSVMLPLVWKDFSNDFVGAVGDTVTIRKPATFTAQNFVQAVGITKQAATETSTPVVLDKHKDVSIEVTSLDLTLELRDFQSQIIVPAMEAISQAVDTDILSLRSDVTQSVTATAYNVSTNPNTTYDLISAGRVLTSAKVPMSDRKAVADEYISAAWRRDPLSHEADKRADEGTALRDAEIGRIHNFDTYESNNIDNFVGVAFHPTAFSFVTRPLVLPRGAADAAIVNYKGLTLRAVYDYDINYKADVYSLDILYGVKTLDAARACLINGLSDSV